MKSSDLMLRIIGMMMSFIIILTILGAFGEYFSPLAIGLHECGAGWLALILFFASMSLQRRYVTSK